MDCAHRLSDLPSQPYHVQAQIEKRHGVAVDADTADPARLAVAVAERWFMTRQTRSSPVYRQVGAFKQ